MTPAALWARALGVALCAHAALPDYAQRGWGAPYALTLLCGLLLCLTPAAPAAPGHSAAHLLRAAHARHAYAPALAGGLVKLYTLTQLRDVLTQSFLLAFLLPLCAAALWRGRGGGGYGEGARGLARAGAGLGALTYLAAAVHKLNEGFLLTPQSCALHAAEVVFEGLGLNAAALGAQIPVTPLALGVIGAEVALAWGCWRGRRWAWALGAAFHLPLTLTIAPAFGLVMLSCYAAAHAAAPAPPAWLHGALRGARPLALGAALSLAALGGWGAALAGALKAALLLAAAAAALRAAAPLAPPAPLTRAGSALCLLYALHALSPYLGVEVQHSGAMLSNLRVDPSCHNSLIFPAWGWDPYVYIDEASLGAAHRPRRVAALRAQLWSVTAVRAMRESWCAPHTRPLRLAGRWGGRAFVIEDLCAPEGLAPLGGERWLGGWQGLQKNLSRSCHQACVH